MDVDAKLLREIEEKVDEAIRILTEIKSLISGVHGESVPPRWLIPRIFVWYEIYVRGGIVDRAELHKVGRGYGYDPRSLGGFFVGENPSLRYTGREKNKVVLERWAEKYVEEYLSWIEKNIDTYRKTSTASLAEED